MLLKVLSEHKLIILLNSNIFPASIYVWQYLCFHFVNKSPLFTMTTGFVFLPGNNKNTFQIHLDLKVILEYTDSINRMRSANTICKILF